jgi:hypothetical protein
MLRHQLAERLEAEFSFRELDEERMILGMPRLAQRDDVFRRASRGVNRNQAATSLILKYNYES